MLYDNTSIAVKEITGDGERKPAGEFSRLKSHYLFELKIRAAGQGQRQGIVVGLVGYARRNFMAPVPHPASWVELNAQLTERRRQRRERKLWGISDQSGSGFVPSYCRHSIGQGAACGALNRATWFIWMAPSFPCALVPGQACPSRSGA
jgi:hypothetical protein